MTQDDGLLAAFALDGRGGGRRLGWEELPDHKPAQPAWIHLDRNSARARDWLENQSGLGAVTCEALLHDDTRPRSMPVNGGDLVILRGINLTEGSDPEDMAALRLWFDDSRVISARGRRLLAGQEVAAALETGAGPTSVGEVVAALAERLIEHIAPEVDELEDLVDELEDRTLASEHPGPLRDELAQARRRAILLRRYIAPQRDALGRLSSDQSAKLEPLARLRIRECADHVIRFVEDLDSMRERAVLTQEQISNRLAEETNHRMYILSIVAAVFLPLGFVTGLLGANVGGIPGAADPSGFAMTIGFLVLVALVEIVALRWLKLF